MDFFVFFVVSLIINIALAELQKPKIANAKKTELKDFQINLAEEGFVIPFHFGTIFAANLNMIYAGNYTAIPIKRKVKTSMFSKKTQITGYKALFSVVYLIGEGGGYELLELHANDKLFWKGEITTDSVITLGTDQTLNILGSTFTVNNDSEKDGLLGKIAFYTGSDVQTQNSHLLALKAKNPLDMPIVPRYQGLCYMVFYGYNNDENGFYYTNGTALPNIKAKLRRTNNELGLSGGKHRIAYTIEKTNEDGTTTSETFYDSNPACVIWEAFKKIRGGVTNLDTNTFIAFGNRLYDELNGCSGVLNSQRAFSEFLDELSFQTNSLIRFDNNEKIYIIESMRQDYDFEDLPIITDNEIISFSADSSTWTDTINTVEVTYLNSEREATATIRVTDDAHYTLSQRNNISPLTLPYVSNKDIANKVATRELFMRNAPIETLTLYCNRSVSYLKIGDMVRITSDKYGLDKPYRVFERGEGSPENPAITLSLKEDLEKLNELYTTNPSEPIYIPLNFNVELINTLKLYELPSFMIRELVAGEEITGVESNRYIYLAKKPTSTQMDFDGYISDNGANDYGLDKEGLEYAPTGVLNANMLEKTLSVLPTIIVQNLSNPSFLKNTTESAMRGGDNLFLIGEELFAYQTFTNLGSGQYQLNNVWRGLLDTKQIAHTNTETIYFLSNDEEYLYVDNLNNSNLADSSNIDVKLVSNTVNQKGKVSTALGQDLLIVNKSKKPLIADEFKIDGITYPDYVQTGISIPFTWLHRNRTTVLVKKPTDASETQEANTDYNLKLNHSVTGLTNNITASNSTNITFPTEGTVEARLQTRLNTTTLSLNEEIRNFAIVEALTNYDVVFPNLIVDADDTARTNITGYYFLNTLNVAMQRNGTTEDNGLQTDVCFANVTNTLGSPSSYYATDNVNFIDLSSVVRPDLLTTISDSDFYLGTLNRAIIYSVNGDSELITFKTVTDLGGGNYRLSGLIRGQRGTELYADNHVAGEKFILLTDRAMTHPDLVDIGNNAIYHINIVPAVADLTRNVRNNSIKPYIVADIEAVVVATNINITWARQTRVGGLDDFGDGVVTTPISEDSELYDLEIYDAAGTTVVRTLTNLTAPNYTYLNANIISDLGGVPAILKVKIYQKSAQIGRGYSKLLNLNVA